ncbi:hypothetical protein [Lederbergia galactosidilytica]|nr:hypothetical protein [Lederbergia galactosidilytica]MBP1916604.1 hypothetical protein [Lederbergia galactosidilytica]
MLFDERSALKIRLEQMRDVEKRILEDIYKERSFIFNRLRELDEQETTEIEDIREHQQHQKANSELNQSESMPIPIPRKRKGRPSRRSKTTKLREIAIDILQKADAPIRGKKLKEQIEAVSHSHIANMTTFMNTIRESDQNIIKVGRGLYAYDGDEQED